MAISLKHNLVSKLPFCAFNGGNDVFVDVGNKSLGLDALMRYLDAYPYEVRDGCAGYERWQRAWTSIGVLAACTCTAGSCLCIGGVCLSEQLNARVATVRRGSSATAYKPTSLLPA